MPWEAFAGRHAGTRPAPERALLHHERHGVPGGWNACPWRCRVRAPQTVGYCCRGRAASSVLVIFGDFAETKARGSFRFEAPRQCPICRLPFRIACPVKRLRRYFGDGFSVLGDNDGLAPFCLGNDLREV